MRLDVPSQPVYAGDGGAAHLRIGATARRGEHAATARGGGPRPPLSPSADTPAHQDQPNKGRRVIKRPVIIFVLVFACVAGIYYFATPSDRDRWLTVLGLSDEAAVRVSEELAARRREAAATEEAGRRREAAVASAAHSDMPSPAEDLCRKYREQAQERADTRERVDEQLSAKLTYYCDLH